MDVVLQVRFFEVSEGELEQQRAAFSSGQLKLKIEEERFSMRSGLVAKFLDGLLDYSAAVRSLE